MPAKCLDFNVSCVSALQICPASGAVSHPAHDRLRRSWRHLGFVPCETCLHAGIARAARAGCGNSTPLRVRRCNTALDVRNALLSQPAKVGAIRPQCVIWRDIGPNERPGLVVRSERGPAMPLSMRQPVQSVLV